jgi:hypothetical protein
MVYMQNKEWFFFLLLNFLIPNVFDPPVQYLQKKYISFIYYLSHYLKHSMYSCKVLTKQEEKKQQ